MRISLLTCNKVKGPCSNWYKHLILKQKKNWQHANRSEIIWILCSSRLLIVSQIGFEKQHGTSCIYPFLINIEWILWKCRCRKYIFLVTYLWEIIKKSYNAHIIRFILLINETKSMRKLKSEKELFALNIKAKLRETKLNIRIRVSHL